MNKKDLIKELEHAKSIHARRSISPDFSYNDRIIDKRIAGQKEEVIQMLKGKVSVTDNIIRVVKKWRNIHAIWENYVSYYDKHKDQLTKKIKKDIKERSGSVSWQRRWIKVYDETLKILEKKKNKELKRVK